jgi:glucose-1-phosphate thymidylyltransferase
MKGIILAGGIGSRLNPLTLVSSKQLLPVYDKPVIFYPLSTLMLCGIDEILIITTRLQQVNFMELLGNGSELGINISYTIQESPMGIADSFIIGAEFINSQKVALILGDNLFHGSGLGRRLSEFRELTGAQIFGYKVKDPSAYGVVELSKSGDIVSIQEKPKFTKSNIAITGLYFFDESVIAKSKIIKPSKRNEYEITDILNLYLDENKLNMELLPRGTAWFDSGTFDDLHDAGTYVKLIQDRTGERVGDPKYIAKLQGWI